MAQRARRRSQRPRVCKATAGAPQRLPAPSRGAGFPRGDESQRFASASNSWGGASGVGRARRAAWKNTRARSADKATFRVSIEKHARSADNERATAPALAAPRRSAGRGAACPISTGEGGETCPVSTEGWTRRVHFVREGGGGGRGRGGGARTIDGVLTPLRSESLPPTSTLHVARPGSAESTVMRSFPSSSSTCARRPAVGRRRAASCVHGSLWAQHGAVRAAGGPRAGEERVPGRPVAPPRPPPPHPTPRTKWTRRVPHPVLIGHAASLTPY